MLAEVGRAEALAIALRERALSVREGAVRRIDAALVREHDAVIAGLAEAAPPAPRAVEEWLPAGAREESLVRALRRFPHLARKADAGWVGRILDDIAMEAGTWLVLRREPRAVHLRNAARSAARLAQLAFATGYPVGGLKALLVRACETQAAAAHAAPEGAWYPFDSIAATAGDFDALSAHARLASARTGIDPLHVAFTRTADALVRGDRFAAREWATVLDRAHRSPLRSGSGVLVALALGKATTIRRALLDLRAAMPDLAANRARGGLDGAQFWDFEAAGPVALAMRLGHGLEDPGPYLVLP